MYLPFPIVAASLGVDNVQLGSAASKIFQVLPDVSSAIEFHTSVYTNLPACVGAQSGNLHTVNGSSRAGCLSFLRSKVVLPAWASGELYRKSLSFEFRSIYEGLLGVVTNGVLVSGSIRKAMGGQPNILVAAVRAILTRNHITGIHHVLVLDEAKAVHQLDFLDRARPMTGKMVLNFLLRDWMGKVSCQLGPVCLSSGKQPWPPECASQKSVP